MQKDEMQELKILCNVLKSNGITVRRENLVRGSAYKVKSGDCLLKEDKILFLDKRLPADQQLGLLVDYIIENKFQIKPEELDNLSKPIKQMLTHAGPHNIAS